MTPWLSTDTASQQSSEMAPLRTSLSPVHKTRSASITTQHRRTSVEEPYPARRTPERPQSTDMRQQSLNGAARTDVQAIGSRKQKAMLGAVAELRELGLDSVLSLPQIVVCGDQSAGKSSCLERLTGLQFPRSDGLCTRFVTEVICTNSEEVSFTAKIIPDQTRSPVDQARLASFVTSGADVTKLSTIVLEAWRAMSVQPENSPDWQVGAFTRDVLSVEIAGPDQPQLTLIDLPGLIKNESRGTTKADVKLVTEITESYIRQPRTICLAIVNATNDFANQSIVDMVREADPTGVRSFGVITKPDLMETGPNSQRRWLDLARNKDIQFKMGWHVLRNANHTEMDDSRAEIDAAEESFFRTSPFSVLPDGNKGASALKAKLAKILEDHLHKELPKLRGEVHQLIAEKQKHLGELGASRGSETECRAFLQDLSMILYGRCHDAVRGDDADSSEDDIMEDADMAEQETLRATVSRLVERFRKSQMTRGHKYVIVPDYADSAASVAADEVLDAADEKEDAVDLYNGSAPMEMQHSEALAWAKKKLDRSRGCGLPGDYNPSIVFKLFRQQSEKWHDIALVYLDAVARTCTTFLRKLVFRYCPEDAATKIWATMFEAQLESRRRAAKEELARLIEDLREFPSSCSRHYLTNLRELQLARAGDEQALLTGAAKSKSSESTAKGAGGDDSPEFAGCDEALDKMTALYHDQQDIYIANVTAQVFERHLVRGLDRIFQPNTVSALSTDMIDRLTSEPRDVQQTRAQLISELQRLDKGEQMLLARFELTTA